MDNINILEILKLDIEYIDENSFRDSDIKYKINSLCNLKPDVCEITTKINESKIEKLKLEIRQRINMYNNDLYIFKKLKELYDKDEDASKNIYLKFGRDKNNNLIALYFNIDKFVINKSSNIYLLHNKWSYYNRTVLFLQYEKFNSYGKGRRIGNNDCGYALICDFIVKHKRLGHGTFMLSNLESILRQVNKKIRHINSNVDYDDCEINEVIAVNGMVCSGDGISYKELVKFYNKNGYPTYHNGYIEDKDIYKEI